MTVRVENTVSSLIADSASGAEAYLPRFTLRKRKTTNEQGSVCLPSVNSAFLDGLFADVAEIQRTDVPDQSQDLGADASLALRASPTKKSRVSLSRAISRCPKSYKSLGEAIFPSDNNLSTPRVLSISPDDLTRQITPEITRSTKTKLLSHSKVLVSRAPSFPHLPQTVSVSSCNSTLTRSYSDLQSSVTENDDKNCYGWFIEMEEVPEKEETIDPYHQSTSPNILTTPEVDDHDAEVEWATAADTVDSVLGDFF